MAKDIYFSKDGEISRLSTGVNLGYWEKSNGIITACIYCGGTITANTLEECANKIENIK